MFKTDFLYCKLTQHDQVVKSIISVGCASICFKSVVMLLEQAYNSSKENRYPRPCSYLFVPIKIVVVFCTYF